MQQLSYGVTYFFVIGYSSVLMLKLEYSLAQPALLFLVAVGTILFLLSLTMNSFVAYMWKHGVGEQSTRRRSSEGDIEVIDMPVDEEVGGGTYSGGGPSLSQSLWDMITQWRKHIALHRGLWKNVIGCSPYVSTADTEDKLLAALSTCSLQSWKKCFGGSNSWQLLILLRHAFTNVHKLCSTIGSLADILDRKTKAEIIIALAACNILRCSDRVKRAAGQDLLVVLLLSLKDMQLLKLKRHVDPHVNFFDLMFRSVFAERERVINHFQMHKAANFAQRHILSDVDDTIICSLLDSRYPSHAIYPGVRSLYAELDNLQGVERDSVSSNGGDNSGSQVQEVWSKVCFISARPTLLKYGTMRRMVKAGFVNSTILPGSFTHVCGNERIAAYKLTNFSNYVRLFPESKFIFFGDNGQGDRIFGENLLRLYPDYIQAVCIHDIRSSTASTINDDDTNTTNGDEEDASLVTDSGIILYRNYIEAAMQLCKRSIITKDQVVVVARSAVKDIKNMRFKSAAMKSGRVNDLKRTLEAVTTDLFDEEDGRTFGGVIDSLLNDLGT